MRRVLLISFFLGLNVILGTYFLLTVKGTSIVPLPLQNFFSKYGLVQKDVTTGLPTGVAPDYSLRIDLTPVAITEAINTIRAEKNLSHLTESQRLHEAAEQLLTKLKEYDYQMSQEESNKLLETVLKDENYFYGSAYQSVVIGPTTSEAVVQYWQNNNQESTFLSADVTEIGVATTVETVEGEFSGFTAVLLAKPQVQRGRVADQVIIRSKPALPQVSDQEVIDALNSYRGTHGVHALNVNQNLCQYAEKRVNDLVAYGGLDNHQGFKEDFADPNNLPPALNDYPGRSIGENLAHQFCKNMTTGESFIAETGTAIIEWCFDSSTKGHREAQLSPEFNNVCVRHADGMYVVIFGD